MNIHGSFCQGPVLNRSFFLPSIPGPGRLFETRLYGCLRLACGWILWHARAVDDGKFRKHICEALFVCYTLQTVAVMRAQFTDRHNFVNWIAIVLMFIMAMAYGSFRFRKGGNLIKIYELPSASNLR